MYNREVRNYLRNYILSWRGEKAAKCTEPPFRVQCKQGEWGWLVISDHFSKPVPRTASILKGNAFSTAEVLYLYEFTVYTESITDEHLVIFKAPSKCPKKTARNFFCCGSRDWGVFWVLLWVGIMTGQVAQDYALTANRKGAGRKR